MLSLTLKKTQIPYLEEIQIALFISMNLDSQKKEKALLGFNHNGIEDEEKLIIVSGGVFARLGCGKKCNSCKFPITPT